MIPLETLTHQGEIYKDDDERIITNPMSREEVATTKRLPQDPEAATNFSKQIDPTVNSDDFVPPPNPVGRPKLKAVSIDTSQSEFLEPERLTMNTCSRWIVLLVRWK